MVVCASFAPSFIPPLRYLVREATLKGIKSRLFPLNALIAEGDEEEDYGEDVRRLSAAGTEEIHATAGTRSGSISGSGSGSGSDVVSLVGMGGSGKTVIASALVRDTGDASVALHFDRVVFLALGQHPMLHDVGKLAHVQVHVKLNGGA